MYCSRFVFQEINCFLNMPMFVGSQSFISLPISCLSVLRLVRYASRTGIKMLSNSITYQEKLFFGKPEFTSHYTDNNKGPDDYVSTIRVLDQFPWCKARYPPHAGVMGIFPRGISLGLRPRLISPQVIYAHNTLMLSGYPICNFVTLSRRKTSFHAKVQVHGTHCYDIDMACIMYQLFYK